MKLHFNYLEIIMFNYKIKISNFKDKPPVMTTWENICKVFELDYTPTPTTPELIAVKRGLAKRFGITLDDVIIYIDETPIL